MLAVVKSDVFYGKKNLKKPSRLALSFYQQIEYWSSTLTSTERVYDTMQRECVTIVQAVFLLLLYLKDRRVSIRTYHNAVEWRLNLLDAF